MGRLKLVRTLMLKDWLLFRSDRRALALAFLVPVLLASAFGLVFDRPGQGMMNSRVAVVLVREDDGPATAKIQSDLVELQALKIATGDRAFAEAELTARRAGVAIVLEKDGRITILHHPLCAVEGQYVEGLLTEIALRRRAGELLKPLGLTVEQTLTSLFHVERIAVPAESSHPFNSYSHSFCGMTLQYLLFWGMESGLLFLREQQRGIWRRLRASPVPLWTIVLARIGSTAGIGLAQVFVTFGFGYLVFGVAITGSWIGFIALALAISGLSAATGMVVAAVGGTEARARHICILVILGLSMLGGLWLPAFLLPNWVRDLALAFPTTWAMQALDGFTWQGAGFWASFTQVGIVWAFVFGLMGLALWRLKSLESRRRRGFA